MEEEITHTTDNRLQTTADNPQTELFYRLTALWILCESMIGGIIHGFKLPFSGLIVGSAAVVCICMIGYYVPSGKAILKATIIVAIFKMMLSPQAPATAYIAVFFQGLIGQLLFSNKKYHRTKCMILGMLALAESAIQRLLVMTLIYGTAFWKALNEFINKTTGQKNFSNYSLMLTGAYVLLHIVCGAGIGAYAARLVKRAQFRRQQHPEFIISISNSQDEKLSVEANKKKKRKYLLIAIWIITAALFLQALLHIGKPVIPQQLSLQILLRSVLVILTWYLFISPFVSKQLQHWLQKERTHRATDIQQIINTLPDIKFILAESRRLSADLSGFKRLNRFIQIVTMNVLRPQNR